MSKDEKSQDEKSQDEKSQDEKSQDEKSQDDSKKKVPSGWLSEIKYILDSIVRIAIVIMIFKVESDLLRELNHVTISESVGLLAAIVIVAFLLVLSLTLFKGSLEQDVHELKEEGVPALEKAVKGLKDDDVKKLTDDVKELKDEVKKLKAENDEKLKKENLELKAKVQKSE